ncbi:MAG: PcfJ domain-containing protein, partial [Aristaeellaceae bacterium]
NVEFRSIDRGYQSLEDRLFLVEYERSAIDPDALVCVGYRAFVPWRDMDPMRIEMPLTVVPMEICVFRWGKGGQRFVREARWVCDERLQNFRDRWTKVPTDEWKRRKKCVSGYTGQTRYMGNDGTPVVLDADFFSRAVEGTRWEELISELPWTDAGQYFDRITLLDRISRYPCIEYLLKLGYTQLARAAVDNMHEGLLNMRGKTARDVLRLTKDEWGWIKGNKTVVTPELLEMLQVNRREGWGLGMQMCARAAENHDLFAMQRMRERYPGIQLKAALKYAYRQHARLGDYLDYLNQCEQLEADLRDRQVLWPTDLHGTHARYTVQLRQVEQERLAEVRRQENQRKLRAAEKDEGLAERIRRWAEQLAGRYSFRACGLVLEPFESATEIIREGMALSICIGTYVESYASGGTILCKLRRESAPEEPFHAVEFSRSSGAMVQCRGAHNRTLDVDEQLIRDFWAAWDAARGTETPVNLIIEQTKKEDAA